MAEGGRVQVGALTTKLRSSAGENRDISARKPIAPSARYVSPWLFVDAPVKARNPALKFCEDGTDGKLTSLTTNVGVAVPNVIQTDSFGLGAGEMAILRCRMLDPTNTGRLDVPKLVLKVPLPEPVVNQA